jgi:hypothetical protein
MDPKRRVRQRTGVPSYEVSFGEAVLEPFQLEIGEAELENSVPRVESTEPLELVLNKEAQRRALEQLQRGRR